MGAGDGAVTVAGDGAVTAAGDGAVPPMAGVAAPPDVFCFAPRAWWSICSCFMIASRSAPGPRPPSMPDAAAMFAQSGKPFGSLGCELLGAPPACCGPLPDATRCFVAALTACCACSIRACSCACRSARLPDAGDGADPAGDGALPLAPTAPPLDLRAAGRFS